MTHCHRVITHRDVTDVPTFFVCMLGKLLEFTGIEYAIQDGGSPFKLAEHAQLIFFARLCEKKWVHENVTFQCSATPRYDLSSVTLLTTGRHIGCKSVIKYPKIQV